MNKPDSKRLIVVNLALWLFAALIYPVVHWIPTGSGMPPKIFEVLVPMFVMMAGFASTSLLRAAVEAGGSDDQPR